MRKYEVRAQGSHDNELENTGKFGGTVQYQQASVHSYGVPEA